MLINAEIMVQAITCFSIADARKNPRLPFTAFIMILPMYLPSCIDIKPDPRNCTPSTPGVCHPNATCTPVTPYVCSSTRDMSYRCECNQGYSGDGINCTGELIQCYIVPSKKYINGVYKLIAKR